MAQRAALSSISSQQPRLSAGLVERALSALVLLFVLAAIIVGWFNRHSGWLDPEDGAGYYLGIAGASMMLILLGYPLRKRAYKRTRAMGPVGFWFRFHMLLGLLGPLTILYHSRFGLGSLNSSVALFAMIVVASSGLIGRFLYSRVHRGYSDRKLELRALKTQMDEVIAEIEARGHARGEVIAKLQSFERCAVDAGGDFWKSAGAVIGLGWRSRMTERRLMQRLARASSSDAKALQRIIPFFFEAVRRAAEFAFYDRLLRLWHLLHLPLFVLLVAAVVLHVVAVHMY